MKAFSVAVAILGISAIGAAAADLDAYPAGIGPLIIPPRDFSGFYYGVNAGYGSSRNCLELVSPSPVIGSEGCQNASGAVAGGQFGYRTQSGGWVFGLEAQAEYANLRSSHVSNSLFFFAPGDTTNTVRLDAYGLLTLQAGYVWQNVLLYAKGGAAVTTARYNDLVAGSTVLTGTESPVGGTIGAGLEYGFAPNLTFGVVYDHLFTGNKTVAFTTLTTGSVVATDRISQSADIITARINYTFGGPSISKY